MDGVEVANSEVVLLEESFDAMLVVGSGRFALPCFINAKYWEKNQTRRYHSITGKCAASRKEWEAVGVTEGSYVQSAMMWRDNQHFSRCDFIKAEIAAQGVANLVLHFSMCMSQQKHLQYSDTVEIFDKVGLAKRLEIATQKHQAYLEAQELKRKENQGKKRYRDGKEPKSLSIRRK